MHFWEIRVILNKLTIRGFRGFYEDQTLEIEPDVTVLTGANDAGKSTVLDVLRWIDENLEFGEDDVNFDFDEKSVTPWKQNKEIGAHATYTSLSDNNYLRQGVVSGWKVEFVCRLMTKEMIVSKITDVDGKNIRPNKRDLVRRPRMVDLAKQKDIGTEISKESVNPSTNKLLELAFNDNYWETVGSLSPKNQKMRRAAANLQLNSRLRDVKPDSLPIEFDIDFVSHSPLVFSVGLLDKLGGRAWLPQRGAGYQKLVKLMFTLLTVDPTSDNVVLIYDEPETSLHADAQHSFRRVLEGIADQPNFQVIYATHSPAMINASRPNRIRLFTRVRKDGIAMIRINNKPYTDENFQMIRSSLGLSPADSLLYAPISVIVEGATETLGLNRLFRRLMKDPKNDLHQELHRLVGLVHFLGAEGSSFVRWAKMAKSQPGVKPIVFVDGDQISRAKQVTDVYCDIPVISFEKTKEIEDIVPREVYFEALSLYAASNNAKCSVTLSLDEFTKWKADQSFQPSELFSKRVCKWYKEVCNYGLEKAEVMDKAIEIVDLDDLYKSKLDDISKIDELIEAIREAADNLHE